MDDLLSETAMCFQQHHRMDLHFRCSSLVVSRLKFGSQIDRVWSDLDYPCKLLFHEKTLGQGPFDASAPRFHLHSGK
jgi:hypothetical protein